MVSWGFPDGAMVKNPPAKQEMQEMQVQSLVQEDPLGEEMATRSSILAGKIPCTEQPGGLQSAAAAKLPQSCLTLCIPIDGSPPGSPGPGLRSIGSQRVEHG